MKSPAAPRPTYLWILCCALLVSVSGCAHAVNAGLALLGVDTDESGLSGETTSGRQAPVEQRGDIVVSTYQHGPTLDWSLLAIGHPSSSGPSFDVRGQSQCHYAPSEMWSVVPATYPVIDTPRRALGPFEVGVAGKPVSFGPLLGGDAQGLGLQAVATNAHLSTQGAACGYSLFAYWIRLGI